MRKFSKLLVLVLVLSLVLSVFAGCGKKEAVDPDAKTVIKFANHMAGESATKDWWANFETKFEAANPQYDLQYVVAGYNDMVTTVTNMAAAGDFVDVMVSELAWIPTLAGAGAIQPIDDVISDELIGDYYEELLPNYSVDGDVYGVPLYFSNIVLFVNTKIMEKANLDVNDFPTTQAELDSWLDALAELQKDDKEFYPIGLPWKELPAPGTYVNAMVTAFGGQVLTDDGKLAPQNEGFDEAMQYYIDLSEKGYNPDNQSPKDMRALFGSQKLGMFFDTTWGFSGVKGVDQTATEWTVTRNIPAMGTNGEGATLLQSHTFAMNNNGEANSAGVDALIKFFETEAYAGDYMTNVNMAFPAVKSLGDMELGSVLEGAVGGSTNVEAQVNLPVSSDLQVDLCTLLNAVILNGTSYEDAYAAFVKEAEIMLK